MAKKVIAAVAAGNVTPGDLAELAAAVLQADERTRLALQVQAGGKHAARRALELAALVLADAAVDVARDGGAG